MKDEQPERDYFAETIESTFQTVRNNLKNKNSDYTGSRSTFYNFERAASDASVEVEQGMIVRMSDKWARICNLIKRPAKVLDEKITDTIDDLIGYLIIMKAYLAYKDMRATTTVSGDIEKCGFCSETYPWNENHQCAEKSRLIKEASKALKGL